MFLSAQEIDAVGDSAPPSQLLQQQPSSMASALKSLSLIASEQKKIPIFSEPAELKLKTIIPKAHAASLSPPHITKFLQLFEKIGEGGFAQVFRGSWRGQPVAVKFLKSKDAADKVSLEAFEQEVKIHSTLGEHPHIVGLYCSGWEPTLQAHMLIMEYLPLGCLQNLLLSREPIADVILLQIALDLTQGLSYIHQQGIIHADIKPENAFLTSDFRAKWGDFGLSRFSADDSLSLARAGSVIWAAPELFKRGSKNSRSTDVYSLSLVFWALFARRLPYQHVAKDRVIKTIVGGEKEEIPSDCPLKLQTIIKMIWKNEPERRPLADKIAEWLTSLLVQTQSELEQSHSHYKTLGVIAKTGGEALPQKQQLAFDDVSMSLGVSPSFSFSSSLSYSGYHFPKLSPPVALVPLAQLPLHKDMFDDGQRRKKKIKVKKSSGPATVKMKGHDGSLIPPAGKKSSRRYDVFNAEVLMPEKQSQPVSQIAPGLTLPTVCR